VRCSFVQTYWTYPTMQVWYPAAARHVQLLTRSRIATLNTASHGGDPILTSWLSSKDTTEQAVV